MGKRIAGELKEFAELLYMQGTPQNIIAEKVGVSKNTIGAWVAAGCWAEKKSSAVADTKASREQRAALYKQCGREPRQGLRPCGGRE